MWTVTTAARTLGRRYLTAASRQSPYEILGLKYGESNKDEIKRAYRKKAMEHHPDRNPDDREAAAERFKEVTAAYEALTTQGSRTGTPFGNAGSGGFPGNAGGFSSRNMSQEDAERIFREFFGNANPEDLFNDIFSGHRRGPFQRGGMGGFSAFQQPFRQGGMTSVSTSTSMYVNNRGQTIRRTETVRRGPDGSERKEVTEEVVGESRRRATRNMEHDFFSQARRQQQGRQLTEEEERQLREAQRRMREGMETMKQQIKTAAKEAVKQAARAQVQKTVEKGRSFLGKIGDAIGNAASGVASLLSSGNDDKSSKKTKR